MDRMALYGLWDGAVRFGDDCCGVNCGLLGC